MEEGEVVEETGQEAAPDVQAFMNDVNSTLSALREQNEALTNQLNAMRAAAAPPAEEEKSLAELLLEDPEKAIETVIARRFGNQFSSIVKQTEETAFETFARQHPDFDEVEADVKEILRISGAPSTKENILGAYTMAIGQKTLAERGKGNLKKNNPEIPKGSPPEGGGKKLSDTDKSVMALFGFSDEKELRKFQNNDFEIKVPK